MTTETKKIFILPKDTHLRGNRLYLVKEILENGEIKAFRFNYYTKEKDTNYPYVCTFSKEEVWMVEETENQWEYLVDVPPFQSELPFHESNPNIKVGTKIAVLQKQDRDGKRLLDAPYRVFSIQSDGTVTFGSRKQNIHIDRECKAEDELFFSLPIEQLCEWDERQEHNPYWNRPFEVDTFVYPLAGYDRNTRAIKKDYPYRILEKLEDEFYKIEHIANYDKRIVSQEYLLSLIPESMYQKGQTIKDCGIWFVQPKTFETNMQKNGEIKVGDEVGILCLWDIHEQRMNPKKSYTVVQIDEHDVTIWGGSRVMSLFSDGFISAPYYTVRPEYLVPFEKVEQERKKSSLFLEPGTELYYSNVNLSGGVFIVDTVDEDRNVYLRRKGRGERNLQYTIDAIQGGYALEECIKVEEYYLLNPKQRKEYETRLETWTKKVADTKKETYQDVHGITVSYRDKTYTLDVTEKPKFERWKVYIYPLVDKEFIKKREITWGYVADKKGNVHCLNHDGVFTGDGTKAESLILSWDEYAVLVEEEMKTKRKHVTYIDNPYLDATLQPILTEKSIHKMEQMTVKQAKEKGYHLCMKLEETGETNLYTPLRIVTLETLEKESLRGRNRDTAYVLLKDESVVEPYQGYYQSYSHLISGYGYIIPFYEVHGRGYSYEIEESYNEGKEKMFAYNQEVLQIEEIVLTM